MSEQKQMYYLQDSRSYAGNAPLWWAKGCDGYTCQIDKAELFTEDEAMKHFNDRSTDIPWKKEDVENAVRKLVDAQYLTKNDKDGFYSRLKQLKDEKLAEEKKANELENLKRYKDEELFSIMENVDLAEIREWTDFSIAFDKAKKEMEWHEHYYPTAYWKHDEELFDDLIKHEFLFKCADCGKYIETRNRDGEDPELCEGCGEKRWLKEDEEQKK